VRDDYLLAIEQIEQRLKALEERIEAASREARYAEAVGALRCFRGIDTVTAMSLVAELHDFMRFDSARGLMAFLGSGSERALLRGQGTSRGDHQGRQQSRATSTHRGSLALPTSPQRAQPGLQTTRSARARGGYRRQSHDQAPSTLPSTPGEGQAAAQGGSGYRSRAHRLHVGRLAAPGGIAQDTNTSLWGSQSADEGRHDPEDARRSFATGSSLLPDSRPKTALPLDGERSCGSALRRNPRISE
jgi:hypothetical protein